MVKIPYLAKRDDWCDEFRWWQWHAPSNSWRSWLEDHTHLACFGKFTAVDREQSDPEALVLYDREMGEAR